MPESLLVVDGFLRTLPDGSLVTDKDGAPCCCGGGPSPCCFTADAPGICNPAGPCCCGSKIRVTVVKVRREVTPLQQDDWTRTSTEVYEVEITGPNEFGQCVVLYTTISTTFHLIGYIHGDYFDYTDNQQDPRILGFISTYRDRLCRCEPGDLTGAMQVTTLQGPWDGLLKAGQCSGVDKDVTWGGGGSCQSAFVFFDQQNDITHYSERVDLSLTTLDNKCCGDVPVLTSGPPGANPPGGNPGQPGAVGGGDCPKCGVGSTASGRCNVCSHCCGCGG